MIVTILGTGNMARGIGTRLVDAGHSVTFLGTVTKKADALAEELRARKRSGAEVKTGASGDPLDGEVVVLAVPYDAAGSIVQQYGDQLAGRVVVDITNPIDWSTMEPAAPPGSSGAEEIAKTAHSDAKVVKAFNTTFAGTLVEGKVADQPLDVLIASDDEEAKRKVAELVESSGLRAIDVGPLRRARQVEGVGYLHIMLQDKLGTGYGSAVKFIS